MILIWKAEHGDCFVYARDKEEELRAYMLLFQRMNEAGYYYDLDGDDRALYDAAKHGDMHSAKNLLKRRSEWDYEYEQIDAEYPIVPN